MKGIERMKGAQSKTNPSPNAFPKLCEYINHAENVRFIGILAYPKNVTGTAIFAKLLV